MFNHLYVRKRVELPTTLKTRFGLFEYLVMPFKLSTRPVSFQNSINNRLKKYLDNFFTEYLDDILIYRKNKLENEIYVREVSTILRQIRLKVNITKCKF